MREVFQQELREVQERLVEISGHIKSTGSHAVHVRLHPDVRVELPLAVQGT